MKTVKVTLVFEFETEDADDETLTQLVTEAFEERVENEELISGAKVKVTEHEEEDEDPDFEDDDED